MLTNGLNSLAEKCQYEWRVAPVVCSYTISKRIETQLQEIEQKSEKKKLEVRPLAVCHLFPPNVPFFFSWSSYRPSCNNTRSQTGLVPLQRLSHSQTL